jgi:hypothetical protein
MASQFVIEGTGAEIGQFVRAHPEERFRLSPAAEAATAPPRRKYDERTWNEVMEFVHSIRETMPAQPIEATSTEAIYG